jgi:hypothetical protein
MSRLIPKDPFVYDVLGRYRGMSLVLSIVAIALISGLAVLIHAVRIAPEGVESEEGFKGESTPVTATFRNTPRLLKTPTASVHRPGVHAA